MLAFSALAGFAATGALGLFAENCYLLGTDDSLEGIFKTLGDCAPIKDIAAVKRRHANTYLLSDEAHSLGVLGKYGRGLPEQEGVEDDVDFIVGTFSKSVGTVGGFCVSNHPQFNILRLACRAYVFTASLPPSVVASADSNSSMP